MNMKILQQRKEKKRILMSIDAGLVERIETVKAAAEARNLDFDLAAAATPGLLKLVKSVEAELAQASRDQ
jgi:hypothetical protein